MRVDPDTCTDPDILAAEVRRLQAVIAASDTLTDAEREAVQFAAFLYEQGGRADDAATLRGLLERTNYPAKADSSTGLR
jgi:hypothetical protein